MDFEKLYEFGFIKVHPDEDDKDYFYWIKHIKTHPFLKGLHIIVDSHISIYCYEAAGIKDFLKINPKAPRRFNKNTNDVCICICKKTGHNLTAVLQWLQKDGIK